MPFRNPRFRAPASSSISTRFLLDHSNQLFRKHRVWGLPPLEISSRQKRGHLRCRCLPPGTTPWSACGILELELSYAGDPDERCVSRAPEGAHRLGPNFNAGMQRSRVDHTKGQKEITNSRPRGWHKRQGRQRGTHTFRLCRSRADHGNLGQRDPRTGYRRNLFLRDAASVSEGKRWNGCWYCISLTLVVRLPRLYDRARDRRAAGIAYVSLDIHVLALPLGRDRLAVLDCSVRGGEVRPRTPTRTVSTKDARSGASSVKNGPRRLLSVAVPTFGLLSASTSAATPSTSESRMNSWRCGVSVHVCPVRVRKLMAVIHSSCVTLFPKGGAHIPYSYF